MQAGSLRSGGDSFSGFACLFAVKLCFTVPVVIPIAATPPAAEPLHHFEPADGKVELFRK